MQAKHNLYNNYDDNANVDSIIEQHRLLDKSIAALETAKKNLGENSKEYKNILDTYMQNSPILRENNITDYASLKEFYNNGGVVKGHEVATKQVENENVDNKDLESSNTKKLASINDFNTQGNLATNKATLEDNVVKGAFKNALGMYGADNTENQKEKYKRGFNVQNGLDLATLENIENLALKDMEETNKGEWAKSKGEVNKQDIHNTYADMLKGDYALTRDSA